jgi:hypothetical protein
LLATVILVFVFLRDDVLPTHHFCWLLSSLQDYFLKQEPELAIERFLFEAKGADFLGKLEEVEALKLIQKA